MGDGEWCGKHKTTQIRFVGLALNPSKDTIEVETNTNTNPNPNTGRITSRSRQEDQVSFAAIVHRLWRLRLARRAGPLLWFRDESNNPSDFFSADPVTEIPIRDFVSFADGPKGYIMDIKSAASLIDHASANGEVPLNPFNRAPLPPHFLRRVARHGAATTHTWAPLKPLSEAQTHSLAVTDIFRAIEDLGYYTDPQWFMDMSRQDLQRFYVELADLWYHRVGLTTADRGRIAPLGNPFGVSVVAALVMQQRALRPQILNTMRQLVSTASSRADKQLGVTYVLGSLAIVSAGAAVAYPWLVEMFSPGVTMISGTGQGHVIVAHPSVLTY